MTLAWLPDSSTPLPAAAQSYARHGWPVLQLMEAGKVPASAHGLLDATIDVRTVGELWRRRPHGNIGVRIPPGLVVIDVDGPAGVAALRAGGTLPRTLTAETARGWHLWFTAPAGVSLRQRAGLLPGVDSRTEGRGYVVAAPSVHVTGVVYTWVRRIEPAPLPGWLVDLLRVEPLFPPALVVPLVASVTEDRARRYAAAALAGEALAVERTPEGGRNHRLTAAWFRLTRDPDTAPFLDRAVVRVELTRAALAAGLSEAEIRRTLRDEASRAA